MSPHSELERGVAEATRVYRSGNSAGAKRRLRRLIAAHPDHPDVAYHLSLAARRGVEDTRTPGTTASRRTELHHLFGACCQIGDLPDQAARWYREGLALAPEDPGLLAALSTVLESAGRLDEAAAGYLAALRAGAAAAPTRGRLGNLYLRQGRPEPAIAALQAAVAADPRSAPTRNNLGAALCRAGRIAEGREHFQAATAIEPRYPDAHVNLGNADYALHEYAAARTAYEAALALNPDLPAVHNNLGAILHRAGDYAAAEGRFQQAVQMAPRYVDAHLNLGNAQAQQGKVEEAEASFRNVLRFSPDQPLLELRMRSLWPAVFPSSDAVLRYRAHLLEFLEDMAAKRLRLPPDALVAAGLCPPYGLMYHGRDDLPIKRAYAAVFRDCFPVREPPRRTGRPRIGMVVTDRHEGIFSRSMKGVIRHMRRSEFDLLVACSQRGADLLRRELGNHAGFVILPDDLSGAAAALEAAACDVLYHWEVGTDALNYFLPFLRLAPVQCTSWGLQVTSGIPAMDYYLSAGEVEPPQAERHYSEALIKARALLSHQYRETIPADPKGRAELGLPEARHLYLCAQQIGKFHPDFDAVLAAILRNDERGVLVITRDRWDHNAHRLLERFRTTMPDVVARVLLLPRMEHPDYLALVAAADVVLDPPYYGGVNTTYDALSLGTPVVTMRGAYHIARYSAACIARTQAHACIATDPEDYARRAVRLGTDPEFREATRETILCGGAALFEDPAAAREHERLFLELLTVARA